MLFKGRHKKLFSFWSLSERGGGGLRDLDSFFMPSLTKTGAPVQSLGGT